MFFVLFVCFSFFFFFFLGGGGGGGGSSANLTYLDYLFKGAVNVYQVKIPKLCSFRNVPQDFVKLSDPAKRKVPDGFIRIQPGEAGRDLETVEEIIELRVGDIITQSTNRMDAIVHCIIKDPSIHQSNHNNMASFGQMLVESC